MERQKDGGSEKDSWFGAPVMTAPIALLESFKRGIEGVLAKDEKALCRRLIADSAQSTWAERQCAVAKFLLEKYQEDLESAQRVSNYVENYLSTSTALVFSHDAAAPSEDYYRIAPPEFSSVLVAFRDKPVILKAERFSDRAWYGRAEGKAGRLVSLKVFAKPGGAKADWEMLYDGSVIDPSYPLVSTLCHKNDCPYANRLVVSVGDKEVNKLIGQHESAAIPGFVECRLTERKSTVCPREIASKEMFGLSIRDFYAIAVKCFMKWQSRPKTARPSKSYADGGVAAVVRVDSLSDTPGTALFHEVRLSEYAAKAAVARKSGYKIENRLSPCEHVRREHTRTLKSGKVVNIKRAVINQGNKRAVYSVD